MTKGNERLHKESQKGYRARLKMEKKIIKGWLRGRHIWRSYKYGSYNRALHGEIGTKANRIAI